MKGLEYLQSLESWDFKSAFSQSNISIVLDYLGKPQDQPKSLHVAGTNGKGSVCAMMSSILKQAGYSVGTNISPHLIKVNERFIINGEAVDDESLSMALEVIKQAVEATQAPLSYHEALTAAAFYLFRNLDWIVMEVGLGGRLDASNVIAKPEVAFITSIALDHQDILGETLEAIAREKAGIIKADSHVVLGRIAPEALNEITRIAKEKNASVSLFSRDFYVEGGGSDEVYTNINKAVATHAATYIGIEAETIKKGLSQYLWPGRLEDIVFRNKKFLLDCAHNPEGIDSLVSYLKENQLEGLDIIFSALSNKDWRYCVDRLRPYIVHWGIVKADSSIAEPAENIISYLSCNGISNFSNFAEDYDRAINSCLDSELEPVLVCGSIYMLGKIRNKIVGDIKLYW